MEPNGRIKTPSATKRCRRALRSFMRSSSTTPMAPLTRTSLTPGSVRQGSRLALENIKRGIGGGAGERIGHESRAVHQGVIRIVRPERLEHLFARNRSG